MFFIWLIHSFLAVLVILNMFIATVSHSFEKAISNQTIRKYQHMATLNEQAQFILGLKCFNNEKLV